MASQANSHLAHCIGKKVSIRLHDGADLRDLVGVLQSEIAILDRHGDVITFDPRQIVAWREVITSNQRAGTGAPLSHRIHEIESAAMATWLPARLERVGSWVLRMDEGVTFRANSVLPTGAAPFGEPGTDIESALKSVVDLYSRQGINPAFHIQSALFPELDDELEARGWKERTRAVVMVADVDDFMSEKKHVSTSSETTLEWLDLDDRRSVEKILRRTPSTYASIESDGNVIAKARLGIAQSWAVLSSLFVSPDARRHGHARALIEHLGFIADRDGISKMLLQVELGNVHAIKLYESMGFRPHHEYIYRELSA